MRHYFLGYQLGWVVFIYAVICEIYNYLTAPRQKTADKELICNAVSLLKPKFQNKVKWLSRLSTLCYILRALMPVCFLGGLAWNFVTLTSHHESRDWITCKGWYTTVMIVNHFLPHFFVVAFLSCRYFVLCILFKASFRPQFILLVSVLTIQIIASLIAGFLVHDIPSSDFVHESGKCQGQLTICFHIAVATNVTLQFVLFILYIRQFCMFLEQKGHRVLETDVLDQAKRNIWCGIIVIASDWTTFIYITFFEGNGPPNSCKAFMLWVDRIINYFCMVMCFPDWRQILFPCETIRCSQKASPPPTIKLPNSFEEPNYDDELSDDDSFAPVWKHSCNCSPKRHPMTRSFGTETIIIKVGDMFYNVHNDNPFIPSSSEDSNSSLDYPRRHPLSIMMHE